MDNLIDMVKFFELFANYFVIVSLFSIYSNHLGPDGLFDTISFLNYVIFS